MICGGAEAGGRRLRLHVRVVPILILIGLLHWALIILTDYTYNMLGYAVYLLCICSLLY